MDDLYISLEQLSQSALMIRMHNKKMQECLKDISLSMNTMSSTWQSPSAQTLATRFHSLLPVFEHYDQIVESYASYLESTKQSYETLEEQLQSVANEF